jgi:phospholipase/carboxylesterase
MVNCPDESIASIRCDYTMQVQQTQCQQGILIDMSESLLDAVEINPAGTPRACIIWLHGLGADGHDFEALIPQLDVVATLGVRVVLPHAPRRPVTINGGRVMPAWYDILAPDFTRGQDSAGVRASEQQLHALIRHEIDSGIPAARVLLAGFSQGGAIVLHTGLRYPQPLAGILALSTYLPLADSLATETAPANRAVPIMMAHGTQDPVVPMSLAMQSRERLQQLDYRVAWHSYPMQHAVCPEEVRDIRGWLAQQLAPDRLLNRD